MVDFRPLPPIPDMDISEESVLVVADEMRVWVNKALATMHEIAVDGNLRTLVLVHLLEIFLFSRFVDLSSCCKRLLYDCVMWFCFSGCCWIMVDFSDW